MPRRKRRKFTPEEKADAVRMVREAGNLAKVARDLDLTETALRSWVKQADIDQASKIISSYGSRFEIHQTPVELTIGEARNWAAASLEARWIVSSDVDSRMPETYIGKLRNYLEQIDDERVAGVCGNIGVWRVSKYGAFEALWESMALVKRVHGGDSALISDQIKSEFLQPGPD